MHANYCHFQYICAEISLQISPKLSYRDVDTQGVCTAADQFYQNFKYWKFAFHKDQDLIDTSTTRSDSDLDPDESDELNDHLLVSSI